MIEVKASNGRLSVVSTVSDFCDAMGYCEFKIPIALRGIKPPPTEATIEGAKAHQKQEQFEKEHFEMETQELLITLSEAKIKTKGNVFTMLYNPRFIPGFLRRKEVAIEVEYPDNKTEIP
jgi:hypothetical protein